MMLQPITQEVSGRDRVPLLEMCLQGAPEPLLIAGKQVSGGAIDDRPALARYARRVKEPATKTRGCDVFIGPGRLDQLADVRHLDDLEPALGLGDGGFDRFGLRGSENLQGVVNRESGADESSDSVVVDCGCQFGRQLTHDPNVAVG